MLMFPPPRSVTRLCSVSGYEHNINKECLTSRFLLTVFDTWQDSCRPNIASRAPPGSSGRNTTIWRLQHSPGPMPLPWSLGASRFPRLAFRNPQYHLDIPDPRLNKTRVCHCQFGTLPRLHQASQNYHHCHEHLMGLMWVP